MTGDGARPPENCFTCNSIIDIIGNGASCIGSTVDNAVRFPHVAETQETEPPKAAHLTRADQARINGRKGGRPRKPRDGALVLELAPNSFGLTPKEERFVAEYLVDENAFAAYRRAHPHCSEATAYTNGAAVLRKTHIQQAVAEARRQQFLKAGMTGEEAAAIVANAARGEMGDYVAEADPIRNLPLDIRRRIKSITPTKYGRKIELHDAPHYALAIAKGLGVFTDSVQVSMSLEAIMAAANVVQREAAGSPA